MWAHAFLNQSAYFPKGDENHFCTEKAPWPYCGLGYGIVNKTLISYRDSQLKISTDLMLLKPNQTDSKCF